MSEAEKTEMTPTPLGKKNDSHQFSAYAKKFVLSAVLTGLLSGILVAATQFLGLIPVSPKDFMNQFVFLPDALILGGLAATQLMRGIFSLASGGKVIGSLESLLKDSPANTSLEAFILNGYITFGIVTAFFGGYFVGSWSTLLLTGHIWTLIGAR